MWLVKRLNNKSITLTTYVLLTDFAPKCSCCEHELASLYTFVRKSAHTILISERRTPHQTFHWTWTTGSPSREELGSNFLWYCRSSIGLPWIKANNLTTNSLVCVTFRTSVFVKKKSILSILSFIHSFVIRAVFQCVLMSFACRPRRLTSSQHKADNHWPLHTPPLLFFLSFFPSPHYCSFVLSCVIWS